MSSRKPEIQVKSSVHFISAPSAIEASSYSSGVSAKAPPGSSYASAVSVKVPPGSILAYIVPLSGTLPPSFPVSPPTMSEDEKWRRCIEALPEHEDESP